MAIHPDCLGATVQVLVDDEPLHEYEDTEEEPSPGVTTRYIEARSGAEFAIKATFAEPFPAMDVKVDVHIDGRRMRALALKADILLQKFSHSANHIWSRRDGKLCKNAFIFSEIQTVDSDDASELMAPKELSSMGTITVYIEAIKNIREIKPSRNVNHLIVDDLTLPKLGHISEKALKGELRSHRASLGEAKAVAAKSRLGWNLVNDEPLVTFNFKYRSLAALQSLGIVSCPPSFTLASALTPTPVKQLARSAPTPMLHSLTLAPNPGPNTDSLTPAPRQQSSASLPSEGQDGLNDEDIIALIKHYRGNDRGLGEQSRKRLLVLLKHYEDKDTKSSSIEQEPVTSRNTGIHIKREPTEDNAAHRREKRRKQEIIVLDD